MPSTTLVHAACFAIGAVVGGGAVAAVGLSRKHQLPTNVTSTPVQQPSLSPVPIQRHTPVLQVSPSGQLDITKSVVQVPGAVLKYGHPGMLIFFFSKLCVSESGELMNAFVSICI